MFDSELLAMLRCPSSGRSLRVADASIVQRCNEAIAAGAVEDAGGREVSEPIDGLLINESETLAYPIRRTIPTLVPDWAIPSSVWKPHDVHEREA